MSTLQRICAHLDAMQPGEFLAWILVLLVATAAVMATPWGRR